MKQEANKKRLCVKHRCMYRNHQWSNPKFQLGKWSLEYAYDVYISNQGMNRMIW